MKTEKEKMIAGELYNASDAELGRDRLSARELFSVLNSLAPSEKRKRREILEELLGEVGENLLIEPPFRCDYGYNISIGDNFFANFNCVILDCAPVRIGHNVLLGPNVAIYAAGHPIDFAVRREGLEYAFPVSIGNDVWVGGNTVINPGVSVGNNVVIGSGSVVTADIPDGCVAAGNPCRVLRKISEHDKEYYFKGKSF